VVAGHPEARQQWSAFLMTMKPYTKGIMLRRLLPLAAALLSCSCARWFASDRPTDKVDENLFLLNALEDTYTGWPDNRTPSDRLPAWIEATRARLQQVRSAIGAKSLDPDLGKLYDDALQFLASYETYISELGVIDAQMKARAEKDAAAAILQGLQTSANSKNDGLGAALEGVFSGYLEGAARGVKRNAEQQAAIEAEQRRLRESWTSTSANAAAIAEKLSRKYRWQSGEAGFDGYKPATSADHLKRRPRDPFLKVRYASVRAKDETAESIIQDARRCFEASEAVPAGEAYRPFRDAFLASAAEVAVAAAIKDLAGYSAGPGRFSKDAVALCRKYLEANPSDPGSYGHMLLARALGANQQYKEAIEAAAAAQANWETDPGYCYRMARLLTLTNSLDVAADWMAAAYRQGWRDIPFARKDPDLANLRTGRPERWEQLTTAKLTWKVEFGVLQDDIVLQNTSPFMLTNVVAKIHIRQGDKTWDKDVHCDAIQPGGTCKAENVFSIPGSRYDEGTASFTSDQT
jgi:hypothetical protein